MKEAGFFSDTKDRRRRISDDKGSHQRKERRIRSNDDDEDDDNDNDDEDDDDDDGGGPEESKGDGLILVDNEGNFLNEFKGARRSRRFASGVAIVMGMIDSAESIPRIN